MRIRRWSMATQLANFLFSDDHAQVGAVDFQYVGRGAAMKDVAYFAGAHERVGV